MNKIALITLALGTAAAGWVAWDNFRLTVTRYDAELADLPSAFDGYTIAQVSDLHNARFGKEQSKLIKAIKAAKPDMIAITGDLFHTAKRRNAFCFLEQAEKLAPCYFVGGNHEQRFADYFSAIKPRLESLGAIVLDDERTTITRGKDSISLIGLADPSFRRTVPPERLTDEKLTRLERTGCTIVLSHRPELFDVYARHNVSLVLTGHAHGGQVRFAHQGLYAVHQGWFPKYTEGIFTKNITNSTSSDTISHGKVCTMIVSRGLGNSTYYPKINNPPELVIVKLHKKSP